MVKRTITKWWMWGLVAMAIGGIMGNAMLFVTLAHAGDLTAGFRYSFVPDGFFWTSISLFVLSGIVCCGGYIAQVVAQIGALFNTHRTADKTWFRGLLWGTIVGYVVLFVTLGFQLGFAFSGSVATAFVWPGFAVAGLNWSIGHETNLWRGATWDVPVLRARVRLVLAVLGDS